MERAKGDETFEWNGTEYLCRAGFKQTDNGLEDLGFMLTDQMAINVRLELFTDTIPVPNDPIIFREQILYVDTATKTDTFLNITLKISCD